MKKPIFLAIIAACSMSFNAAYAAGAGDASDGGWGGGGGGGGGGSDWSSGGSSSTCSTQVYVAKTCYNTTVIPAKMLYKAQSGDFVDFSTSMQFVPRQEIQTPYECGSYKTVTYSCSTGNNR